MLRERPAHNKFRMFGILLPYFEAPDRFWRLHSEPKATLLDAPYPKLFSRKEEEFVRARRLAFVDLREVTQGNENVTSSRENPSEKNVGSPHILPPLRTHILFAFLVVPLSPKIFLSNWIDPEVVGFHELVSSVY